MLADAVTQFHHEPSISIQITEDGRLRKLRAVVQEELCRIGTECILNSLQHAHPSRIYADVIYERRSLRLRCRDDGRGLAEEIVRMGRLSGHWELPGMKERAKSIGAKLHISTAPGKGTEIDIHLSASTAYEQDSYRIRLAAVLRKAFGGMR